MLNTIFACDGKIEKTMKYLMKILITLSLGIIKKCSV